MLNGVASLLPQEDETAAIAQVSDLHVTFERQGVRVYALRGVSIAIQPGEILGLVGESGSGKTVLGLSLLGLLRGDPAPLVAGQARVLGVDMASAVPAQRRKVRRDHLGAIFQEPMTSLNPTMKIGDQLLEVTHSTEENVRLLEAVGVPKPGERLRNYPHEFSGGQLQRIMIAMAIAGHPSLVIADEPTTALDVTVQSQILGLIRDLRKDLGCSFLLVTHDLGVAAEVADRIAVLYGGKLLEIDSASNVLNRPAHPYSIGLLESRLRLTSDRDRPLVSLPGEPPDPRLPPAGCPFAPRCALRIDECEVQMPSLLETPLRGLAACIRLGDAARYRSKVGDAEPWNFNAVSDRKAIRIRDVQKHFTVNKGLRSGAQLQALRGIDLDVARGESVALVGESGCGKTTLLKIVAGLISHDGGELKVADDLTPQMVFQDALGSLTPWLTVGELVGERLHGDKLTKSQLNDRIDAALARVGLPTETKRAKPRQLSGGQAQRVALARTIVKPSGLLLADEPTSALDVSLGAVVLNLIAQLRRELGLTVLFVTHDLAAARIVADRIAVMYLGEIVEAGPAERVIEAPEHPYTRALRASLPGEGGEAAIVKGEPANPTDPPSGCPYHPRCPVALDTCSSVKPKMVEAACGHGAACIHVEPYE